MRGLLRNALYGLVVAAAAGPALAEGCKLDGLMQLPVTMQIGRPVVTAKINGADARLAIDSGAFFSMLTPDAVRKFNLSLNSTPVTGSRLGTQGTVRVRGATGEGTVGVTVVDAFGDMQHPFRRLPFLVGGGEAGVDGFIGENILGGIDAEYDFANGLIRLWRARDCAHSSLAYWAPAGAGEAPLRSLDNPNDRFIVSEAMVNGQKIRVMLDSGAPRSILDARAAARAGVAHEGPNVVPAGFTQGVGGQRTPSWIAPVDSFKIGDEEIKNTRLRIGALSLGDADMLLGADFFLSHRIYVARSVDRIFFTYNGGPVFRLDRGDDPQRGGPAQASAGARPAGQTAGPASAYSDEPKDAPGFARRAAASLERGALRAAETDFSRAIELDPKNGDYLLRRARVRLGLREPQQARADVDQAIGLNAEDGGALELRGALKLRAKDTAGAKADFDAAAALNPDARLRIGAVLIGAGDYAEAIAQLTQWIAANPKSSELGGALNDRCWARALANVELDEALADCNRAVRLTDKAPGVMDSRGLVHVRLGHYDAAIADYDAALKLQPKNAWSLYGRGLAKRRKGMAADGDADLKAAAAIAPNLADEAKRLGLAS